MYNNDLTNKLDKSTYEKNNLGTQIAISATSSDTAYTCPSDGYIQITEGTWYILGGTSGQMTVASASSGFQVIQTYVKKGMKVYRYTGTSTATFTPME